MIHEVYKSVFQDARKDKHVYDMPIEDFPGNDPAADRRVFKMLWERAKQDDFEGLNDEQRRIAQALQLHAEEYSEIFDNPEVLDKIALDPEEDVNPFVHISLHAAVESQLENRDPVEVLQFYNAMRRRNYPRHDTIHLIGAILVPLISRVMKWLTPFDNARYVKLLRKYKSRKPEKIWDLLEEEFEREDARVEALFGEKTGNCRRCDAPGAVDENGLCDTCADMLERDFIRQRKWERSTLASCMKPEEYETLREQVIAEFGGEFEILNGRT